MSCGRAEKEQRNTNAKQTLRIVDRMFPRAERPVTSRSKHTSPRHSRWPFIRVWVPARLRYFLSIFSWIALICSGVNLAILMAFALALSFSGNFLIAASLLSASTSK